MFEEIIETIKVTHKNLLNEAANLKSAHESVEVIWKHFGSRVVYISNIFITLIKDLKKVYLLYRRNTTGETKNIFESEGNNENLPPAITTKIGLGF